jgi:hypothetical protein
MGSVYLALSDNHFSVSEIDNKIVDGLSFEMVRVLFSSCSFYIMDGGFYLAGLTHAFSSFLPLSSPSSRISGHISLVSMFGNSRRFQVAICVSTISVITFVWLFVPGSFLAFISRLVSLMMGLRSERCGFGNSVVSLLKCVLLVFGPSCCT